MKEMPGYAENHGLMRPNQIRKGCRVASRRLPEYRFDLVVSRRFQNVPF